MEKRKENRKWHWLFWLIYFAVNHAIFSKNIFNLSDILINLLFVVHNAGAVYITLDYWTPTLYKKKQYALFLIATILTTLFFGTLLLGSLYVLFNTFSSEPFTIQFIFNTFHTGAYWSNVSALTLMLVPYFVSQRIEMERQNRQLEKEKLEAELKLLKSQLHPHFLFNALNNIYFLIKKDPDTAAEALAGFSNLLRFQLYDANNPKVTLDKEIAYLQQFAEIAQLRKGENFTVNWDLPNDTKNIEIAPLLLMPLVENAFKHGANKNGQIDISLALENNNLHFKISNSKEPHKSQGINGFEEGGIGLTNIQKRLHLIYPNRHKLKIEDTAELFFVDLKLESRE